jgi:hypothetical protein
MLRPGKFDSLQGLKPNIFNACCGTTKEAAEKVGNEDLPPAASPSRAKALAYRAGSG